MDWTHIISSAIGLAAVIVGGLAARHIKTPSDAQRAANLAQLAADAAALVAGNNPKNTYAQLLPMVVQAVSSGAGVPTDSGPAIERAAAGALARLGKLPAS